jgi:hypothetical protein
MIYYFNKVNIRLLEIIDGDVWVIIDLRAKTNLIKLLKYLLKNKIYFYFGSPKITGVICKEDLSLIIDQYLSILKDKDMFDLIINSEFDYIKNLINFMNDYDCHTLFKSIYSHFKSECLKIRHSWPYNEDYYLVKEEYIRDYISSLEREIKLYMLLE